MGALNFYPTFYPCRVRSRLSGLTRRRWILGGLLVLVLGWAIAATISLVFFPIESTEPPPTPVTVETTITVDQP